GGVGGRGAARQAGAVRRGRRRHAPRRPHLLPLRQRRLAGGRRPAPVPATPGEIRPMTPPLHQAGESDSNAARDLLARYEPPPPPAPTRPRASPPLPAASSPGPRGRLRLHASPPGSPAPTPAPTPSRWTQPSPGPWGGRPPARGKGPAAADGYFAALPMTAYN